MFLLFFSALFISFFLQLIVIYFSHKKELFIDSADEDKPQRFHTSHTPRAGGIGIFLANAVLFFTPGGWKLILAGFFAFLSGIMEDISGSLSPKFRLILQALSALIGAFLLDAVLQDTDLFSFPYPIAVLFAVFAVVGMTNAINIIDGFNGLAGGISIMILLSFLSVSMLLGDHFVSLLTAVNIAAILGFMFLNFPKGRIFMGDGGAYFVGFAIAESGILLYERNYLEISALYILAVLIYPVCEVIFSIYRKKIVRGISPMQPDKSHFHMLINKRITRSNPKTSLRIWFYTAPFIFLPILVRDNKPALIVITLAFVIFYVYQYRRLVNFKQRSWD